MAEIFVVLRNLEPVIKHVEKSLNDAGLLVSREKADFDAEIAILLVGAPQKLLERQAQAERREKKLRDSFACHSPRRSEQQGWPVRRFTISQRHLFDGIEQPDFFTPAERASMVMAMLAAVVKDSTTFNAALAAANIEERVNQEFALLDALARLELMHDVSPLHFPAERARAWRLIIANLRSACTSPLRPLVPLDTLRAYWGEQVAYYFGWESFYIHALGVLALVGLATWARRPSGVSIDDDPAVPLYALAAVVWALCFVSLWRSRQAELAFRWGVGPGTSAAAAAATDLITPEASMAGEPTRPNFVGRSRVSEVTGEVELYIPTTEWAARLSVSYVLTAASLSLPVAVMIVSLNLQGYITEEARSVLGMRVHFETLASFALPGALLDPESNLALLPVVCHAVVITLLNGLFRRVARVLTEWENHRTQRHFDSSLVAKRFFFEAFDCYISLFYIAFELQDVPRLRSELASLFATDCARRVLLEAGLPFLTQTAEAWRERAKAKRHRDDANRKKKTDEHTRDTNTTDTNTDITKSKKSTKSTTAITTTAAAAAAAIGAATTTATTTAVSAATDAVSAVASVADAADQHRPPSGAADLHLDEYDDFDDFLEMAIQFGYVTLFASAFPLGAALAFGCNLVELVSDLWKLTHVCRRPSATRRVPNIGVWGPVMQVMAAAAIFTNLTLFGLASDQLAAVVPSLFTTDEIDGRKAMLDGHGRYLVVLLVAMEHALLLVWLCAELLLTPAPRWVRVAVAQRQHEAKAAAA